jgi:heme exporter protein D
MSEFFAMGGYAAYVWPAYGISLISLAALAAVSWRTMNRAERMAERSATEEKPQD